MTPGVVRQLRRVKQLHADRAAGEQRRRQASLDTSLAAVDGARDALVRWLDGMPRRQDAIYAEVMGRTVEREALDDVRARIAGLRDRARVLEQRVAEAEAAAAAAKRALDEAADATARARRVVSKFDELIDTLRRAAALDAERKEDAELEEVAETLHHPSEDGAGAEGGAATEHGAGTGAGEDGHGWNATA